MALSDFANDTGSNGRHSVKYKVLLIRLQEKLFIMKEINKLEDRAAEIINQPHQQYSVNKYRICTSYKILRKFQVGWIAQTEVLSGLKPAE